MKIRADVLRDAAQEMRRRLEAAKVRPPYIPSIAHGSQWEERMEDEFTGRVRRMKLEEAQSIIKQAEHLARLAENAAEDGLE